MTTRVSQRRNAPQARVEVSMYDLWTQTPIPTPSLSHMESAIKTPTDQAVQPNGDIIKLFYDSRRFETELYWKRSTYFWTLTAAALTGYTVLISVIGKSALEDLRVVKLIIVCFGFTFSLAWYYVNRSSKATLDKWDMRIRHLNSRIPELDDVVKIEPNNREYKFWNLVNGYPFSSTRINLLVNIFVLWVWLVLLINQCFQMYSVFSMDWPAVNRSFLAVSVGIFGFTLLINSMLFISGKRQPQKESDSHRPLNS